VFNYPKCIKDGRCDSLPSTLAKVRTLTTHLKHEPLVAQVSLLEVVVAYKSLVVVLFNKVLDNGSRLPKSQVGVRVVNGGKTSIRVNLQVGRFLHIVKVKRLNLVWYFELFKYNCDLKGIETVLGHAHLVRSCFVSSPSKD
jgi:hypothetical protein